MNCPTCGSELVAGEAICRRCGSNVGHPADPAKAAAWSQADPAAQGAAGGVGHTSMSRVAGIVIFALGVLFFVLSMTKIFTGLGRVPLVTMLTGGLVLGLSFIRKSVAGPDAPPVMPPAERLAGVFYDPDPVFKNLRHHPRWLGPLLIMVALGVAYQFAFMNRVTPERIANEMEARMNDMGLLTPEQVAEYKEQQLQDSKTAMGAVKSVIGQLQGGFIAVVIFAALYLLCVLAFGGRMNFWQGLSVAAYGSLPPVVVMTLLNFILLYAKPAEDIDVFRGSRSLARADLGLLFNPAEHPVLFAAGSLVNIFSLYGWWVTVSGLHNTSTKLSRGAAWGIAALLWLLGMLLLVVFVAIFPGAVKGG